MEKTVAAEHLRTCIEAVQKGDESVLVGLYKENQRPVRSFVLRNNGTHDEADDMLQEALVIFWERVSARRFESAAQPGTFILGVVRNLWMRRLAQKKREQTGLDTDEMELECDDPSALQRVISAEETGQVFRALESISAPCRRLLTLFYWEERSMEDIAGVLGFANAQTAKAKKYQCKQALKQALQKMGLTP
jgi:RNA polymerase sigma factor (sigma-70 family)